MGLEEVKAAVKKMKNNKAASPTGVVADMLKAAEDAGCRIYMGDGCV